MKKHIKKGIALSLIMVLLTATIIPCMPTVFAVSESHTELVDLTVNFHSNPLGIETDNLRFGWKMDSDMLGQSQSAYQIVVREASVDGPVVWDSGSIESGLSVAIPFTGDTSVFLPETRYYWTVTVTDFLGGVHSATAYFETGAAWGNARWITMNGFLGAASNTFTYSATNMNALMFRTERPLLNAEVESARLYITGLGTYQAYINGKNVINGKKTIFAPGWTAYTDYVTYQTYDVSDYLSGNTVALSALVGTGFYDGRNANATTGVFRTADNEATTLRERCLLAKLVIKYKNGQTQEIVTEPGNSWQISGRTPVLADGLGRNGETYDGRIAKEFEGWNDVGYTPAASTVNDWNGAVAMNYTGYSGVIGDDRGVPYEYARLPWIEAYTYQDWELSWGTNGSFKDNMLASGSLSDNMSNVEIVSAGDILPGWSPVLSDTSRNPSSPYRTGTIDWSKVTRFNPGDVITIPEGKTLVVDFGQNASAVPDITLSGSAGTVLTLLNGENISDGNSTVLTGTAGWAPRGLPLPSGVVQYHGGAGIGKRFQYTLGGSTAASPEHYMAEHHFVGFRYLGITPRGGDVTIYNIDSVAFSSVGEETGFIETSNPYIDQFVQNSKWSQVGNYVSVPTDCPTREYNGWLGDMSTFAETGMYHFDTSGTVGYFVDITQKGSQQITRNTPARIGYYADTMPTTGNGSRGPGWTDGGVVIPWQYYRATGDKTLIEKYWQEMCDYGDALNDAIQYNEDGTGTWATGYTGASNNGTGWGDHLGVYIPTGQFTATMMQLNVNVALESMARALGKTADVAKYSAQIDSMKTYFKNRYIDPATGDVRSGRADDTQGSGGFAWAPYTKVNNAQTALAWMLQFGIYDTDAQRDIMVENLAKSIANKDRLINPKLPENSISAGFLGVHVLMPALSKYGRSDTAYDLLTSTDRYSFLYAIAQASVPSTSIWEEWVLWGTNEGDGTANMTGAEGWGRGSQNHYAYGASSTWLYQYLLGIEKDDQNPAFKHIILQPTPNDSLDYAKGSYESYYGKIESDWTIGSGGAWDKYHCVVPANTTATLYLPIGEAALSGFQQIPGSTYLGMEEHNGMDCAKFNLLAGGYNFEVTSSGLVASLDAGYFIPDQLMGAVLASIRADEAIVGVNTPLSYTVSLMNVKGSGVVTLSFTADGRYMDLTSATGLNGFSTAPGGDLTWEYVGSQLWKGTVKLICPGFANVEGPLDVLKIAGVTRDLLGDTTVTLTDITVTGDVDGFSGAMPGLIKTADASISIVSKTVFSKYDLNHDGKIDELDLAIVVYYYLANDLEADWEVVKFDIASARDCDVAFNGRVDLADMIEVIANYCDSY